MIKLALPGMIMIEAQFSVLEILTIAAGRLGTAQLAAQSVLVTVTSMSFNIPFPLAIATSTRVANLIGAGLSDAAMVTTRVVSFFHPPSHQPLTDHTYALRPSSPPSASDSST